MASFPQNGYAEVMAGTNFYSGQNTYSSSCPKTPIPPTIGNDLTNKTYVDAATGGGVITGLTEKGSFIVGNGTAPSIWAENPYETVLTTTTVYDWNALGVGQSRTFTTTVPTALKAGYEVTITYDLNDSLKGTITSVVGNTVTLTISNLTYTPKATVPLYTAAGSAGGFLLAFLGGQTFDPESTPPAGGFNPLANNVVIQSGQAFAQSNPVITLNTEIRLQPSNTLIGTSSPYNTVLSPVAAPASLTNFSFTSGVFAPAGSSISIGLLSNPPVVTVVEFWENDQQVPPAAPPFLFTGSLSGYTLPYSTGTISINGDVAIIASPVAPQGVNWGVINATTIGAVTSVSGGVNIVTSGSLAAPVVNLRNPLTAQLNMGAQSLRDSAGAVGSSGQVLTAGVGGQTLWATPSGLNPTITDTNTNATYYPTFVAGSGSQPLLADIATGAISLNPSNGDLNVVDTLKLTQGSLAVGKSAGLTAQGSNCVAVGYLAGNSNQSNQGVAIGAGAGQTNQTNNAVAIGAAAGGTGQQLSAVAVGVGAGNSNQGQSSVAVGSNAGGNTQGVQSVAVGNGAGQTTQGAGCVAVGFSCGLLSQATNATAVGNQAGNSNQGVSATAVGVTAGGISQGQDAVAIGNTAGYNTQGVAAVAIGKEAGRLNQSANAIAIGIDAADSSQATNAIAIGNAAGQSNQGTDGIAIGRLAGATTQASFGVAIGYQAQQSSSSATNSIAIGQVAGQSNQAAGCVAIGLSAGQFSQNSGAVAIGGDAGGSGQSASAVAVGSGAGQTTQGDSSVALGYQAANNQQGASSIAIGREAGKTNQGTQSVAIGQTAGQNSQGTQSVAIGHQAGITAQSSLNVAIGAFAGQTQATRSVAIGYSCGQSQGSDCVAIGNLAGQSNQSGQAIAIGADAGTTNQGNGSVAVGRNAGNTTQSSNSVAVGLNAAQYKQGLNAVAIGANAARDTALGGGQGANAVAIGSQAGETTQGARSIAIGLTAAQTTQGTDSVAIGNTAGQTGQGNSCVAMGEASGNTNQGLQAVAIGLNAGQFNQGQNAIAIGVSAGTDAVLGAGQGQNSVAIGRLAGNLNLGASAIAIGNQAGTSGQVANSICLNASGAALNPAAAGCFIDPIRNVDTTDVVRYNTATKEVSYSPETTLFGVDTATSYTVVLSDAGGNLNSANYNLRVARYIKIGRLVYYQVQLSITAKTGLTAGNTIRVSIPFTSLNVSDMWQSMTVGRMNGMNTAIQSCSAAIPPNADYMNFFLRTSASANSAAVEFVDISTTWDVRVGGFYIANSA